jgi:hypothetical protein
MVLCFAHFINWDFARRSTYRSFMVLLACDGEGRADSGNIGKFNPRFS